MVKYNEIKSHVKRVEKRKCGSKVSDHYVLNCLDCGVEIFIRKYDLEKRKHLLCFNCSNKLKSQNSAPSRRVIKPKFCTVNFKNCKQCGKVFVAKLSHKEFCDSKCYQRFQRKKGTKSLKSRYSRFKAECNRSRYKNKKTKEFTITFEQFEQLHLSQNSKCHYCGDDIPYSGTGLDRIDNTKGYDINNVLLCCTYCNRLRGDKLSVKETEQLIKTLQELRGKKLIWK